MKLIALIPRFRGLILSLFSISGPNVKLFIDSFARISYKYVIFGKSVFIGRNSRIEAVKNYQGVTFTPQIEICSGVTIQQNLHLTCAKSIHIGKNTAIAANVTITDIDHPYINPNIPIEHQKLNVSSVYIGDDCKIYNNAVILKGVTIGKHCVIGANSVVNKDVPDYSIAVGIPVKIVKQYNFNTGLWERSNNRD